jgi:hypothetical protein
MIKLWLDDVRPAPVGWKWVKTAQSTIAELEKNEFNVEILSLDHDLGDDVVFGTGYDVMKWIEEGVFFGNYTPPKSIKFHTANPIGRKKMEASLNFIKKFGNVKIGDTI